MDDEQRLNLICEAVRYSQRVAELGMPSSCYTKALREPIFFLWEKRQRSKLAAARFRSKASLGLSPGKGQLVYDHAIPFRYLQAELMNLDPVTPQGVRDTLTRYSVIALITKEENALLNSNGLAHTMPPGSDVSTPLARYDAVGIALVPNPAYTQ